MSKELNKILYYNIIVTEIEKKGHPTLEQLLRKIEQVSEYDDGIKPISQRTFEYYKKEIDNYFGIKIKYNHSAKGYEIDTEEEQIKTEDNKREILEKFSFYYTLNRMPKAIRYMRFEPRLINKGIDNILVILKAIMESKKLNFTYQQYEKNECSQRTEIIPLGLKQFKGFWYLISYDKDIIKSFGLDRISGLEVSKFNFTYPKDFSIDEYYKDCYGIVRPTDTKPETIYIKAIPVKAAYYKVDPLHTSQKIVKETENYTIFSLYIYRTYDFEMEIRSHKDDEVCICDEEILK